MGKVRKPKQKKTDSSLKTAAESPPNNDNKSENDDPFLSLKLNLDDLIDIPKKSKSDDTRSLLSYKALKSNESTKKIIKKKDKLNLKKRLLMKKIDMVNQMKKELKVRDKRKKTLLIGDTNPLHDALPSLESLLKNKSNINIKLAERKKKTKAIEKAKQRKRKIVDDISIFKKALKDKTFKSNPFDAISNHIQAIVEMDKMVKK
ncbi:hypothetical protein JTB14_032093 [Gonioctena quinquepunctata]|nr:hypothetical protein JTB14_032093 [Gonioctena quinquepunctata]